jgi:hypothetical protein
VKRAPTRATRLACALLIALATGAYTYSFLTDFPSAVLPTGSTIQARDFTYSWLAARAVAQGVDPYEYVLAQKTPSAGGWFYAYPAALVALPFAWLPVELAGAVFVAVGCGLLAFVVSREGLWRLAFFLSAPAVRVCRSVQWAPFLIAGAVAPGMLGIVAAKPNIAAAFFAYQTSRRDVLRGLIGGMVLVGISLLLAPTWPADWIHTLRSDQSVSQYQPPILTLLGWPIALAALKWRRREARLLLVMGCLPQNGFFYEQLALFLVPITFIETVLLAGVSHIGYNLAVWTRDPTAYVETLSRWYSPFMIASLYLPCVAMVLRRPNEGVVPVWIEKRLGVLPGWLRGRGVSDA